MEAHLKSKMKNASQIDFSDGFTPTTSYRTLALDTLSEKDDFRLKERDRRPIPYPWGSLTTEGINKAQSAPLYKYTMRGGAAQKTLAKTFEDAGMHPKKLISERAFADNVNKIVVDARKKKVRPRETNPLDPKYSLPSFKMDKPPEQKFIKNNLDTSDIKGTSPHPVQKPFMRNTLFVDDIEGTRVGWRPKYRENFGRNIRDLNLDVKDINKMRKKKIKAEKEAIDVGVKRLTRRPQSVTYSLKTDDIEGAQSRSRATYLPCGQRRTQYVHTNNTQDIRGATPKSNKVRSVRPYSAPIDRTGIEPKATTLMKRKIRESIQKQYHDISTNFKSLDRDGSGKLTTEEFSKVMNQCDINIADEEAKMVVQGFDTNNSGTVDYAKLLKAIGPNYTSRGISQTRSDSLDNTASTSTPAEARPFLQVANGETQTSSMEVAGESGAAAAAAAGSNDKASTSASASASQSQKTQSGADSLRDKIKEARTATKEKEKKGEGDWKPSKFAVVKADRPQTVHSTSRSRKPKDNQKRHGNRPMTSPAKGRGASAQQRHVTIANSPQAAAMALQRPKSAFTTKCRMQTWENSQLREDIATIRALR